MLNILVIEDNLDHFLLIEDSLSLAMPDDVSISHEVELAVGLEALANQNFDLCLCDLQLSDASIAVTVEALKQLKSTTPIIVLSSLNSIDVSKELLSHDIQDYLPKEELSPTLLNRMCTYAIQRKHQQLQLEKRNADMQAFCASLSHDFKAYLRRIQNIGHFLKEDLTERLDLNEEENKWLSLLDENAAGLSSLVEGLGLFLTVGHVGIHMESINLSVVFKALKDFFCDILNEKCQLQLPEAFPTVYGNASQLQILFQNLIVNGIKYNSNEPLIKVTTHIDEQNGICEVHVNDNGIGFEEEYFNQIFTPFRRLHGISEYAGSGLGLSIVKRIIEIHQGDIKVESALSEGSTFIVCLPMRLAA